MPQASLNPWRLGPSGPDNLEASAVGFCAKYAEQSLYLALSKLLEGTAAVLLTNASPSAQYLAAISQHLVLQGSTDLVES